ncbi:glucose-6-phosphate dehydrogenase [Candidatus Gracilibacteria bacterium]|nr:glucose-6-phosphate dehydrogenase [Candidatus Gracilibacteria bacterium]
MNIFRIKKPFILTIFGASGDLAKLKIFPALYSLAEQNRFPKNFHIVGYARTEKKRGEFQKEFSDSIKKNYKGKIDEKLLKKLTEHVQYFSGKYDKIADFKKYRTFLAKLTKAKQAHIAYFSVPPFVFKDIISNLGETKTSENEDLRIVLEKPFGEDTKSARDLFHFVARYFHEDCVYLLDHYLGKNAVQSILHLRHSNRFLNLMMKGPEVANIQITAAEEVGVTNRVGYFDTVGTIKDMVQSHLLQILAFVTMSIPITENADAIHREKQNILSALKFIPSEKNIVIGQYESYKKEKDVPKDSKTETFAALRLFIDRESWYKVPIYIRTGKKLHEKHNYIVIELKKFGFQPKEEEPNRLIIELQPKEQINIRLLNKYGITEKAKTLTTTESIACVGDYCLPEHALLLLDVVRGRRANFLSFQEIISTWRITDNIINFIKKAKLKPQKYKDGSEGPESQNQLTKMQGFKWFDIH